MRDYSEIYKPYRNFYKDVITAIDDFEKALHNSFIEDGKINLMFRHILTLLRFLTSKIQELEFELKRQRKK